MTTEECPSCKNRITFNKDSGSMGGWECSACGYKALHLIVDDKPEEAEP